LPYRKTVPTPKILTKGKQNKKIHFATGLIILAFFFCVTELLRLLELQQTGLIDYWDLWFRPMPPQCTGNVHSAKQMPKNKLKPLSLKNLTGAFLVIAV
jgi:hypothetical protein